MRLPWRYSIAAFIIAASIYVATLLILRDYFQIPYNLFVIAVIVTGLLLLVVYGIIAHYTEH